MNTDAKPISKKQIKKIHTLKREMGMTDRAYRQRLGCVGVKSSKELTFEQAKRFIHYLAIDEAKKNGKVYAGKAYGSERISERQMGKIRAMWEEVSYLSDPEAREAGLNALVKRLYHVDMLNWLPRRDAEKLVKTLWSMKLDIINKRAAEEVRQMFAETAQAAEAAVKAGLPVPTEATD